MNHDEHDTLRVAIFPTRVAAEAAVHELLAAGFPKDSLGGICPASEEECAGEGLDEVETHGAPSRRTPKAIAAGGAVGGVLGGAAFVAAGPAGPALLVVGQLVTGLATGGVFGGLVGLMTGRGLQPDVADFYDRAVRKGRFLVVVEGGSESPALARADEVLARAGAEPLELPR